MTSLTLEEIVKWGLAIMVVGTVFYLIFIHFNPAASEQFWGKINNATGFLKIGKEKLDYEFEMPQHMVENVETINKTILELSESEEIVEKNLKLQAFRGCELTVRQDYKGDLKLMIKNAEGQIKYYKTYTPYSPCIIDIDITDKDYEGLRFKEDDQDGIDYRIKYASEHIRFVERINFIKYENLKIFKVDKKKEDDEIYEGDYMFLEKYTLIKIGKDICFVGYRAS